jgi:hypothetical protein
MLRKGRGIDRALHDLSARVRAAETREVDSPGSWLWSFLHGYAYQGGGAVIATFDAQSQYCDGEASWSHNNVDAGNYNATPQGGPYIDLNGSDEYLSRSDDNWNRIGAFNLLCCSVVRGLAASGTDVITGKYDTVGNERCWLLRLNSGGNLDFGVSADGTAETFVVSSYTWATGEWTFVAGFFEPSALLRIYVAQMTDTNLTIDDVTASVPASCYNANVSSLVTVGAQSNEGNYWQGSAGPMVTRANVPSSEINMYVAGLFDLVRWSYLTYP